MEPEVKCNKRPSKEAPEGGNVTTKKLKAERKPFDREAWERQQKEKGPVTVQNMTTRKQTKLNEAFTEYYKAQFVGGGLLSEEEYGQLLAILKLELPSVFRVASMGGMTSAVQQKLKMTFLDHEGLRTLELAREGVTLHVAPPQPLEWYHPKGHAYHYAVNKQALNRTPFLKTFKSFMAAEQDSGNLARQEAVSMIPALLLGVESHHFVLDLCAAPGSKTGQLLELLHHGLPRNAVPTGMVVANDVDVARCYLLTHVVQRLGSPCYMVMNYPAQYFPTMQLNGEPVLFDRILCDVPCSGDGTLRKSPDAGWRWSHKHALNLHPLQLLIASRAVEMLKVGGTLVYSTCSFHPVENEAVVSALLAKYQGVLEIQEVSDQLPALQRKPGLTSWQVCSATGELVNAWTEDLQGVSPIIPSMFPPAEPAASQLKHCMRLFAHLQDTGGFFITVLKKVAPCPERVEVKGKGKEKEREETITKAEEQVEEMQLEATADNDAKKKNNKKSSNNNSDATGEDALAEKKRMKRGGGGGYPGAKGYEWKEDPFYPHTEAMDDFYSLFGMDPTLPWMKYIMRRGGDEVSKIYLFNELGYSLLTGNPGLRIVNAGVRLAQNEHTKNKKLALSNRWRVANEGLAYLVPHVTLRLFECNLIDFFLMLIMNQPMMLEDVYDKKKKKELQDLAVGSFILIVKAPETVPTIERTKGVQQEASKDRTDPVLMERFYQKIEAEGDLANVHLLLQQPLALVAWRGTASVGLHVSKLERLSLRNLFLARAGVFSEVDERAWSCEDHGHGMAVEKEDKPAVQPKKKKSKAPK